MIPQEHWRGYAEVVWDEFSKRSGHPERIMSPAEWWLLRGWLMEGIPLRIVLRGFADTKRNALSLTYYGPGVRQAYEQWRKAMVQ